MRRPLDTRLDRAEGRRKTAAAKQVSAAIGRLRVWRAEAAMGAVIRSTLAGAGVDVAQVTRLCLADEAAAALAAFPDTPELQCADSVDEANSVIGIALLHIGEVDVREVLAHIQNDLFDLGADLCRPQREHRKVEPLRVSERQVSWIEDKIDSLEDKIDSLNAALAPLDSFILPGGSNASAHLHHAPTVIRRAERYMAESPIRSRSIRTLKYANRLSDLLFVLARYLNRRGRAEMLWRPGLHRA